MTPRYPDIRLKIHSRNPLALVSAVRQGLRLSQVEPGVIHRFTEEALRSDEPEKIRKVCAAWASVEIESALS